MAALSLLQIRDLSSRVFNLKYNIEVMVAVAEADPTSISLTDIALALRMNTSTIQKSFGWLIEIGMLTKPEKTNRTYFTRTDSAGWDFAFDLAHLKRERGVPALHKLYDAMKR
jgi:predicted transcriptional regulator